MRRVLWMLSLLALLVGPLMRVAEAADDLARELDEPAQVVGLEEPDGGVGDESADSMCASSSCELLSQQLVDFPTDGWLTPRSFPSVEVKWSSTTTQCWDNPPHAAVDRVILFECFLC